MPNKNSCWISLEVKKSKFQIVKKKERKRGCGLLRALEAMEAQGLRGGNRFFGLELRVTEGRKHVFWDESHHLIPIRTIWQIFTIRTSLLGTVP